MIRIRYTFNNSDSKISWNDCLTEANSTDEALQSFRKIATSFVLKNLVELRAFEIIPFSAITGYNEYLIEGQESAIKAFIESNKESE